MYDRRLGVLGDRVLVDWADASFFSLVVDGACMRVDVFTMSRRLYGSRGASWFIETSLF